MKKAVLVTGATGNLGSAVVKKFLDEGFRVAALDNPRSASKLKETENLRSFPVDLTDETMTAQVVEDVYAAFPVIEMGIFTVGGFAMGDLAGTGLEELDRMYRLNFITAYNIARHLFEKMAGQGAGGQMVFIGARPAQRPDQAGKMLAYSLSKSLVFRLAEVINSDGRNHGITASVIIPSVIDTPQNRQAMPDADFSRWVSPGAVAENIHHLITPAGKELRKTTLRVYGES